MEGTHWLEFMTLLVGFFNVGADNRMVIDTLTFL